MADPTSTWSRATSARLARRIQGQETPDSSSGILNYTSLRSTASRFSLNEQFAATRREYEFGHDDVSSIWEPSERGTIRTRQLDEMDAVDVCLTDSEETSDLNPVITSPPLGDSDFYDILCVSRESSAEDIRRAYLRLFSLLNPDMQPPYLRQVAEYYFMTVQAAFETLLDPFQRANYDLQSYEWSLMNINASEAQKNHDRIAQMRRHLAIIESGLGIWELSARFDAPKAAKYAWEEGRGLRLFDVEMNYAVCVDLTELDWKIRRMVHRLQQRSTSGNTMTNKGLKKYSTYRRIGGTTMTLRGSIYGLLQEFALSVLVDQDQLCFDRRANRDQVSLLRNGLIRPLVAVELRHIIPRSYLNHSTAGFMQTSILENSPIQEETVVEIESGLLPDPSATARLRKSIILPFDKRRSFVTLETEKDLLKRKLPRLATTLERPTAGGWLLLRIASGDWRDQPYGACHYFSDFTRVERRFLHYVNLSEGLSYGLSRHRPPQVEIAFKNRGIFESQESRMARSRNKGICAFDTALNNDEEGAWTVTALAEPKYCSVSARYSRDVNLSTLRLHHSRAASPKTHDSISKVASNTTRRRFCIEAEIGADSSSTGYVAFRCLRRAGRLARVGFEMSLGVYSLRLSVYWSRLGRRINVPFYLCSTPSANLKTLLLATIVPFASFTLWELWDQHRYRQRRQQRFDTLQGQQYTQKRRAEADTLTSLMAPAVERRQKLEPEKNDLVILSAKYGIKARGASDATAWGAAEVADVTIPVAALVDRNQLLIPSGVHKSYILGFWDPDLAEEKVLHVRYSYQGKEATVEVRGDDEQLVLPPSSVPRES